MEGFPWDDLRKILPGCCQVTNALHGAETLPKISIGWVGCTKVTDDRQTDGRTTTNSEHEHEFTFAKNWRMMMPSTMILTMCISMVLKSNRGLALDIGSRCAYYVGLAVSGLGGRSRPPDKNFQSSVWRSSSTSGGGLTPPQPLDKSNSDVH